MNEFPEDEIREETPAPEIPPAEKIPEIPAEELSMKSAQETPAEAPAPDAGESSGGYRRSEVSDASYIPRDEAPRTPRTYSYAEPLIPEKEQKRKEKQPKKGMGTGAVIALCLLCVILGTVGGLLFGGGRSAPGRTVPAEETEPVELTPAPAPDAPEETEPAADAATTAPTEEPIPTADPHHLMSAADKADEIAATEIYELACRQVVGISTEVSYRTYYGTGTGTVTGTGFVVTEDGYIITNYHVIEYAASDPSNPITVMFYDGESYPAVLVGYEGEDNDVAVLKIDAEGLECVKLGDSDAMCVGETIFAVGNPMGELDYTMTRGIISAMNREISTEDDDRVISMFQIDAAVNSGNSGGPVFNTRGEVIGIVTAKYSDTYEEMGIEGLGFAIPINDAVAIANDLIENGYVRGRAYMGISTKGYTSDTAEYYNWPMGAYVYAVVEGSCSETAGVQAGDIITAVDEFNVESVSDLQAVLKEYTAGEEAVLTVYRSGETVELTIVFDEKQPEREEASAPHEQQNPFGGYGGYGGFGGFGGFPW